MHTDYYETVQVAEPEQYEGYIMQYVYLYGIWSIFNLSPLQSWKPREKGGRSNASRAEKEKKAAKFR
jgi:hypothetical protein